MARSNQIIAFLLLIIVVLSVCLKVKCMDMEFIDNSNKYLTKENDKLMLEVNNYKFDTLNVCLKDSFIRTQVSIWFRNTYPNYNVQIK